MTSEEDGVHYHTIKDEHPEHGVYELVCRVLNDADFHVEPDQSTFPTDSHAARMECIDHASDILQEEYDSASRILVDEDTL